MAHVVTDAIRGGFDYPGTFADTLAPHATRFGLRRGDGVAVLRWLLDLVGDPETGQWMEEARATSTASRPSIYGKHQWRPCQRDGRSMADERVYGGPTAFRRARQTG